MHVAQSRERLHHLGLKWQAGVLELLAGHVELFAGDPVAAENHMRIAKESFIAIGDQWFVSTVSVDLPRPATRVAAGRRPCLKRLSSHRATKPGVGTTYWASSRA